MVDELRFQSIFSHFREATGTRTSLKSRNERGQADRQRIAFALLYTKNTYIPKTPGVMHSASDCLAVAMGEWRWAISNKKMNQV